MPVIYKHFCHLVAIPDSKNHNKGKKAAKIVSFDDDNDDEAESRGGDDSERTAGGDLVAAVSASVPALSVTDSRYKHSAASDTHRELIRNDSKASIISTNSVYSYDE